MGTEAICPPTVVRNRLALGRLFHTERPPKD